MTSLIKLLKALAANTRTLGREYTFLFSICFILCSLLCPSSKLAVIVSLFRPSEERLYKEGWKETSYFFGDSDTFMTIPTSNRERRLLRATMSSIRGTNLYPSCDTGQLDNEMDASVVAENCTAMDQRSWSDEDMFLCQNIPASIETLPSLLRKNCGTSSGATNDLWEMLEKRRGKKAAECGKHVSMILTHEVQPRVACRGFGSTTMESLLFDDTVDSRLALDYLPTLRRIAVVECAAEEEFYKNKANLDETTSSRRTTRRSARNQNQRVHYFDKLSKQLQLDLADLNSSTLGSRLAEGRLMYNR